MPQLLEDLLHRAGGEDRLEASDATGRLDREAMARERAGFLRKLAQMKTQMAPATHLMAGLVRGEIPLAAVLKITTTSGLLVNGRHQVEGAHATSAARMPWR